MRLYVHREARPWVPDDPELSQIFAFYDEKLPDGSAHLWPRKLVDRVYGKRTKPMAFRAFTRGDESHLFVDDSETKDSVAFLLAHELCHQVVAESPSLHMAFDDARPVGMRKEGDVFHERDPEERFCDGIANRLLGTRYDRSWWRTRTGRR